MTTDERDCANPDSREPSLLSKRKLAKGLRWGTLVFLTVYVFVILFHTLKPLPAGIGVAGPLHRVESDSIEFLYDLTYKDPNGDTQVEQEIFDRIFKMIEEAEEYILLDMFLFDSDEDAYRDLSSELADRLIEQKSRKPELKFQIMTDMYNTFYGSVENEPLARLEEAGIEVAFSDMDRLRDSNFLYSGVWRILFQPLGLPKNFSHAGWIERDGESYSIRSVLKALNCKANHRKLLVVDTGSSVQSIVTSANPSAYGSKYSNVALFIEEDSPGLYNDIHQSEKAIAEFSNEAFVEHEFLPSENEEPSSGTDEATLQFVTEGKVRETLVHEFSECSKGDSIDIAMFLLTERRIVDALVAASQRGADIRIVVDPSKYLFGQESEGVPNRPVMAELHDRSDGRIEVRWYDTHGEEFHSKMTIVSKGDGGEVTVFLGSANLTRRNIGNYNLEADVRLVANPDSNVIRDITGYYDRIWNNRDGVFTLDYDELDDDSSYRYWKYRFQEQTGLSAW